MDESNLSTTMYVAQEQTADESLLNQNVSFSSSMELSVGCDVDGGDRSSLPNLSFSLNESERIKLKQMGHEKGKRSVLKDLSMNIENAANQSNADSSMAEEAESTLEESESVINIEDTIEPSTAMMDVEQSPTIVETSTAPLAYFEQDLVELGRRCWTSSVRSQQYTKGCFWSPDGTCLLVPVHLDGMHVMELPLDLYGTQELSPERTVSPLQSAVHVPEGGTVYDCVWYPHMNSQQSETCFWLATRQHEPIQMWDAFDGRLRCSYSGYDQADEVEAAISLAFSHDGQQIFGGYKKCIKIFDTNRPGRSYDEYPVKRAISCLAQTTNQPQTLTCGNWSGYIQHFDLRCPPKQGALFTLGGHSGGITQLRYAADSSGEWQLFSGARKCSKLLRWDMRNYSEPLQEFSRHVDTNQRIQFDLSPQQSWLASGDTKGLLQLWNLAEEAQYMELPIHGDACNGVGFHPTLPLLASSSGQFHFYGAQSPANSKGDANETHLENTLTPAASLEEEQDQEQPRTIDYENAVLLLWCGKQSSSSAPD